MTRRLAVALCAATLLFTACGDEDAGGGPAGGFDDRAPESPASDDEGYDTTLPPRDEQPRVEGTDTEAGTPPGRIGEVEGEGDPAEVLPEDDDGDITIGE